MTYMLLVTKPKTRAELILKLFMKYSIANDRQTGRRVVLWIRSCRRARDSPNHVL